MPVEPEEIPHLGDYRLHHRLADEGGLEVWQAEQISVGRQVLLEAWKEGAAVSRERFLADTRARAAVDHPFITSVYEAVDHADACYRTSELMQGGSLQAWLDARKTLDPLKLTRVLRAVAEANLHQETHARATGRISLGDVVVDGEHVTRIRNLAIAGERGEEESVADMATLGRALVVLVSRGRPGTTRVLTLLKWMRGREDAPPLTWNEVIQLCDQIEHQLSVPAGAPLAATRGRTGRASRRPLIFMGLVGVAALVGISVLIFMMRPAPQPPALVERLAPVLIPAGDYPGHEGEVLAQSAFLIDAHETSIGEYREFLGILDVLQASRRHRTFDHPDQPEEKTDHVPQDWQALLEAARRRGEWNGLAVTLDSPVAGVDWWDATAYANWKKARLPTQREWAAACGDGESAVGVPQGELCEWAGDLSINPANPLGRKQYVILGGSRAKPDRSPMFREWVADPSLRRSDLGFRLVRDVAD